MTAPEPSRVELAALARRLLLALRRYTSPGLARVVPPHGPAGYGADVCGLEGYARSAMLAAMLVAGARGEDPDGFLERFAEGLAAGVDPAHPEHWVRPSEHGQAVVECFPLAVMLELTRPWLWDRLASRTQEQVVSYLGEARSAAIPDNNWLWFVVTAETFLRSVGADWSPERVSALLARGEQFYAGDGWYRDGTGSSFDHYNDFAWHAIGLLWSTMRASPGIADELVARFHDRARLFVDDARHLVGGDGGPLVQGRSLVYRFAIAAPFWAAGMAGVAGLAPGGLRRAASAIVGHFTEHGVPDEDGVLTLGWYRRWPDLAQSYSSTGSPYWAGLGLLGLALPESHPLWTAPSEPLPIEVGDFSRVIGPPGWLVSGTASDGIVRVTNHGTDHGAPGELTAEAPMYARLGYSTATWPVLAGDREVRDQSVAVLAPEGRPSERSGIQTLWLHRRAGTLHGASRWRAHWVDSAAGGDHGEPATGTVRTGPWLTVASLVRGATELRIVVVDESDDHGGFAVRLSGWARGEASTGTIWRVVPGEAALPGRTLSLGAVDPVNATTQVDVWDGTVACGTPVAVAIGPGTAAGVPGVTVAGRTVSVSWPDGASDEVTVPTPPTPRRHTQA